MEIESIIVTVYNPIQIGMDEWKDVAISKEFDMLDSFKNIDDWCKENKSCLANAKISFTKK